MLPIVYVLFFIVGIKGGVYEDQESVITIVSPPNLAGTALKSGYTLFTKVPHRTEDEITGIVISKMKLRIIFKMRTFLE